MNGEYIKNVRSGKKRPGKAYLLKFLAGKKLTRSQSIKAKCYDCNGMGEAVECDIVECSLYPYSPYKLR